MTYIDKIKEFSQDNKYTKWYCNIVTTALGRVKHIPDFKPKRTYLKEIFGYVEVHHILPRSLCERQSWIKDINNQVFLTAKEHFMLHVLLPKMLTSTYHVNKMLYALNSMSNRMNIRSVTYARMKHQFLEVNRKQGRDYFIDNPEQKKRVATVFKEAHERLGIDYSSDEWIKRSFNSPEALAKSKVYSQTEANREKCRHRELSKGKEALSLIGKNRQQKLVDSFGSDEAYSKHLSERMLGRKRIFNPNMLTFKMVHEVILESGWVLWSSVSKEDKKKFMILYRQSRLDKRSNT